MLNKISNFSKIMLIFLFMSLLFFGLLVISNTNKQSRSVKTEASVSTICPAGSSRLETLNGCKGFLVKKLTLPNNKTNWCCTDGEKNWGDKCPVGSKKNINTCNLGEKIGFILERYRSSNIRFKYNCCQSSNIEMPTTTISGSISRKLTPTIQIDDATTNTIVPTTPEVVVELSDAQAMLFSNQSICLDFNNSLPANKQYSYDGVSCYRIGARLNPKLVNSTILNPQSKDCSISNLCPPAGCINEKVDNSICINLTPTIIPTVIVVEASPEPAESGGSSESNPAEPVADCPSVEQIQSMRSIFENNEINSLKTYYQIGNSSSGAQACYLAGGRLNSTGQGCVNKLVTNRYCGCINNPGNQVFCQGIYSDGSKTIDGIGAIDLWNEGVWDKDPIQ